MNTETFLISSYAIGRLPSLIYSLIITLFFLLHRKKSQENKIAGFYFLYVSVFHLGFFLAHSIYTPLGSYAYYLMALSPLGLLLYLRFAYMFPKETFAKERKFAIVAASILACIACSEYFIFASQAPIYIYPDGYGSSYVSKLIAPIATLLLLWILILFARKSIHFSAIYHAKENKQWKDLLFPGGKEATTARNFCLLVFLEAVNSSFIASGMVLRQIPYLWLLLGMNIAFFLLYTVFVVIYLRYYSGKTPISFKILSFSLNTSLFLVMLFSYFHFSTISESYDKQVKASLSTFQPTENLGVQTPEHLGILLSYEKEKPKVLYTSLKELKLPFRLNLWQSIPGMGNFTKYPQYKNKNEIEQFVGKRLYTKLSGYNMFMYPFQYQGKLFLAGFTDIALRKSMHRKSLGILFLYFLILLIHLVLYPLLLARILSRPIQSILSGLYHQSDVLLSKPQPKELKDEVEALSEGLQHFEQQLQTQKIEARSRTVEKKETEQLTPATQKKVETVEAYIQENYNCEMSREGLAAMVDLSAGRLGSYFKLATGEKIGDYTNRIRIEKALTMLQETDKTILEIAFEVGFESLRTFNRVFSQKMGVTPSKVRQKTEGRETS